MNGFRCVLVVLGVFAVGCGDDAHNLDCPEGDLLRCRAEASDPAVQRTLAPLLAPAPDENEALDHQ